MTSASMYSWNNRGVFKPNQEPFSSCQVYSKYMCWWCSVLVGELLPHG